MTALYRVARLHALLGHERQACDSLESLSQAGLFGVGQVRHHEAFSPMRGSDCFRKAVGGPLENDCINHVRDGEV